MLRIIFPCLLILLVLSSFYPVYKAPAPEIVDGYVPIYGPADHPSLKIGAAAVRPIVNGGKIFVIGDKLFQVEVGAGIHIIDYADRQHPEKLGFLTVPGCTEVALKDSMLFTNHYGDMVVLDVSKYPVVEEKSRMLNVFPEVTPETPPERMVYYECVDRSKGSVIGWEKKKVSTLNCFFR
ncbi:hypothetical protein [Chitinophaga alhagiae]|uniref:hypothetical protein n=1 Tax=Chitinophaga alhagiae TaxID=2203219 RepID=UPI000E5BF133|nr:hypothetical protein [Chitinophaga alhagiae]